MSFTKQADIALARDDALLAVYQRIKKLANLAETTNAENLQSAGAALEHMARAAWLLRNDALELPAAGQFYIPPTTPKGG